MTTHISNKNQDIKRIIKTLKALIALIQSYNLKNHKIT